MKTHILKLHCPDAVGLLARITGFIAASGGNLLEVSQYTDPLSKWFFSRLAFTGGKIASDPSEFRSEFESIATPMGAEWTLRPSDRTVNAVMLTSRQDHCLTDLLWRWRSGELNISIPMVLSNHGECRGIVEREGVAFEEIDFNGDKSAAFEKLAVRLRECNAELIVLARFMQILPDWLCQEFEGRIINIHHSFLPAFVGANPYRRAFERGVKLIGATCHYATSDLDQGPIIEQNVHRVSHRHSAEELKALGQDVERNVLLRAVQWHLEDRVIVDGNKTVVFVK